MRKARIFFLVLLLIGIVCVGVSSADLQIPLTLSDVPMTLPQKDVAVNFSSTNNLLRMSTNWTPQYDDFFCTVLLRSGTIVPMYRAGNDGFISYEKVTDPTLIDRVTLTSESDDGSEEVISLDREGRILSLETASASEYLEYLAETGIYRYIVNLPDTDLPLVALAATYDDNGNLLSYRVPEANNTEVTYDAAGTIVQVDALVFLEGTNTPLRITWDDAQERWYNPNTGKTVTYEAFVETEHLTPQVPTDKDADQADEASNTNGDTQEDGHTVGETESSVSPTGYLVSPPPITLNELNLKYNASDLRHLSLVKPSRSGNAVQIQDEGYSSVTLIINNTQQAMTLENGVWSSPVPDGSDYAIRLTNASGISSTYSASGVLDYSVCDSDTALILSADGIYAYDGTGRENVTATYSSDGYLATYTYRNAEDTKKVTYNPYGDVLTYQAFSADGSEYRFLSGTGWQLQQSEDTWISCEKPEDVNPSDLPPLLVLSRKKSFQNSWYPRLWLCYPCMPD